MRMPILIAIKTFRPSEELPENSLLERPCDLSDPNRVGWRQGYQPPVHPNLSERPLH